MKIIELEEIDSTNEFCKRLNFDEDVIVVAERQTAGKGTKGRSFVSDEGGLYVSVMRKLENFDFSNTFSIMINACVAVCKTVKHFGVTPTVKWANDVLVNGKKICGTLIENRLSSGNICTSIVGMGINVNNVLPPELSDIATSLSAELSRNVPIKKVRAELLKNLQKSYTVQDYKKFVDWFGQEVTLDCNGQRTSAIALDVDEDGRLVCNVGGVVKRISSAEMSLRLKCASC